MVRQPARAPAVSRVRGSARSHPPGTVSCSGCQLAHLPCRACEDRLDPPQPEWGDHFLHAQLQVEVIRYRQDLGWLQTLQALLQDAGEATGRGRLLRRVESQVHRPVSAKFTRQEERGLTLVYPLPALTLTVGGGDILHIGTQLEQQRQPQLAWSAAETVDYLL